MKSVLIVYATTEGQTRKIAEFIARALNERGVKADLIDSATRDAALVQPVYAAMVACGSLHQHHYQASLIRFIKDNQGWLAGIPGAFVAVSLTAATTDQQARDALCRIVDTFCRQTGWHPGITRHVAGALRYSRYGCLKRAIMKRIAKRRGGDTDTSHDHEYTDWKDLTRFADELVAAIPLQEPGHQGGRLASGTAR